MFSEVNQTSVNLCAWRAAKNACALAQKAHHGGRDDRPFRALNVCSHEAAGPACGGCGRTSQHINFEAGAVGCHQARDLPMTAVTLIAVVSMVRIPSCASVNVYGLALRRGQSVVMGVGHSVSNVCGGVRICNTRYQR